MIRRGTLKSLLPFSSLLAVLFAVATPAFSQNCALCYTQAASATARFIQALRSGILILIIPPTLMTVALGVLTYKKRKATID